MNLPVYETFHSWQGEGAHLGRSAFFIRLFGCPVHCPWCDSAGTWHPDYVPKHIERLSVHELANRAATAHPDFVVITGGEPAIHDLQALTHTLRDVKLPVHLETSGAFPLRGDFDWVTLSPKWLKAPLPQCLENADEFKIIVEDECSIERWVEAIGSYLLKKTVWLHPEWSQRNNPVVLNSITERIKMYGAPFRAGWQLHKNYRADATDARARPDASLAD